ncbi:Hypothetical predicted protein [Pelobates cultripes]|uniref:Uncharacterized protein n=1 Tax=Pelobates cultripes TaxID=61616 RepID=A0AAD1WNS7_PELCU|nr:Hypothetical predicted protein [Pelobates cultripes]
MWPDHAPIFMTRSSPLYRPAFGQWRLNEALLLDLVVTADFHQHLTHYLQENETTDIAPMVLWEAHKPVIKSHFIVRRGTIKKGEGSMLHNPNTGDPLRREPQTNTTYNWLDQTDNHQTRAIHHNKRFLLKEILSNKNILPH